MELVYLWVEDYKNIHKQGFNFSPRFRCEYDKDNNELTIEENDDYIPNLFGENINVTAIVGKNGSGKSSVLEFLILKKEIDSNYILVCIDSNENIYYESNINIRTDIKKMETVLINPYFYFSDYLKNYLNHDNKIEIRKYDILNYLLLSSLQKDFQITSFMYISKKLKIQSVDINDTFSEWIRSKYADYKYVNKISFNDFEEPTKAMQALEDARNSLSSITDEYHKFLIIIFIAEEDENLLDVISILLDKKSLVEKFEEDGVRYLNEDDFKYYILAYNETKIITEIHEKEKEIFLRYAYLYDFDFIDSLERNYDDLSHGEKTIFGQFLVIYYKSKSYGNNYLFLLDEGDLSLHPYWQKKYIFELYNLLKKLNKKFHFILTTHSPFLISDLPRQNIIFLDKDENGNCKVVDGLKEKKQTFGANIHTLLSDSFFMEDGLIGDFAKGKIDKAIKLLNQDNLDEKDLKYCEQIISIIGEPIIKNQLQRMLDSKRLKKVDEIDAIKRSMEAMQKRLDELEK